MEAHFSGMLALLGAISMSACKASGSSHDADGDAPLGTNSACTNGGGTGTCSSQNPTEGGGDGGPGGASSTGPTNKPPQPGVKDGTETDVDCGGPSAPKCAEGKGCLIDSDCEVACSYAKKCIAIPSCAPHLGGDTCGFGEEGEPDAQHESCCRSLPVSGYTDAAHVGQTVYLDKYEITAGRIRAWIEKLAAENNGNPNVKAWIAEHRPAIWDPAWDVFLPTDYEGGTLTIARRLLGDPRPEDSHQTGAPGPGVILPPPTDQVRHMGVNYQFGSEIYVDLHGNNCATYAGSFGSPTYYYPPDILNRDGQLPRADGVGSANEHISAKDLLDVKSMNCITNAMLAAFCAWDGGQLATNEVLDYITATPSSLGSDSGCGTQHDDHGQLLSNIFTNTVQTGGRCPDVKLINATFDAGDALPVPNSPLNQHNYSYPDTGYPSHDKAWQISAPGRGSLAQGANLLAVDAIRINPGDEPWMDLAGNVSEAALDMADGSFTGNFALRYRGIGYGSARSDLNLTTIPGESIHRIQRPEAKGFYTGGRCMRFK
jgi:hypothetical protein